ncbi:transketolase [Candidatus Gottesmanbacteria bacterium RIFCSPHIGHO2_01_FULL_39_10]|uniref:Transketolase n=1 Tax=Candidatus Gottesmanbacteria bacterium RIFCSPHIGHO2_01_FULL_39_10 TaxID=1798375 RepID=A0A1F5ZPD6_9BACT|nr:MAG: transketolase [Candidatus Gottesmanbacteria bacterium RIFCSPHIGHO2_01_FULL_39_10]
MRNACLSEIYNLAKKDERVVYIGSDLSPGTLDDFKRDFPERYFMEGISEAHIVGMAAGMAMNGYIPYVNTIATFLTRRCFEQIVDDVAVHNLPVRFIASGGGLIYAPLGPTHIAFDDMAILRPIPNMTIVACADAAEMKRFMPQTLNYKGPIYVRVSGDAKVTGDLPFKIGRAQVVQQGKEVLLVTTGVSLKPVMDAYDKLKRKNIESTILHVPTVKPIDKKTLLEQLRAAKVIVTVEEGTIYGGLGSAVAEILGEANFDKLKKFKMMGVSDEFPVKYGSQADLMKYYKITPENIYRQVKKLFTL